MSAPMPAVESPQVGMESRSVQPSAAGPTPPSGPPTDTQLQSAEANSGAAFVRKLALRIDPANAPRLHLFAWNLFLGSRGRPDYTPQVRPMAEIISRATMESLVATYMTKFHPCYSILQPDALMQRLQTRWLLPSFEDEGDALLCGVAAIGFLFSNRQAGDAELDLVQTGKHLLEAAGEKQPCLDIVVAWLLRTAYLRMTAKPHAAWIASCTTMHMVEAAGYHLANSSEHLPELQDEDVPLDIRRRLFGIARHLNIWISFDLGRSRVVLQNASTSLPSRQPREYTTELLELLPVSEKLDPQREITMEELHATLTELLERQHTEPPSILAQTNLVLCIWRRMRAFDYTLSGPQLDKVLTLTARSIESAQSNLNSGSPWHHVANVPFQVVCILLAIDSPRSIAQLGDAIRVLSNVVQLYDTDAAREALHTACLLVLLHQRRKEADVKSFADIIRTYAPSHLAVNQVAANLRPGFGTNEDNEFSWVDDLTTDMPNLQGFDFTQCFESNGQWDVGWMG
jgi:hypothetical protein